MSCEHCTHCRDKARQAEQASLLHERGTRLLVTTMPELGVVTYWRAGTELSDQLHVVYCETDCQEFGCAGHWIQTSSLALAPAARKSRKARAS